MEPGTKPACIFSGEVHPIMETIRQKTLEEMSVPLACCRPTATHAINPEKIAAREPNETRKNLLCPHCGMLVILSLERANGRMTIDQEVIDLGGS
jgi:hypothetical protein